MESVSQQLTTDSLLQENSPLSKFCKKTLIPQKTSSRGGLFLDIPAGVLLVGQDSAMLCVISPRLTPVEPLGLRGNNYRSLLVGGWYL